MEEITKDLRSSKKNGRPSNEERSSGSAIRDGLHLLAADLIRDLRSEVKIMTPQEKTNLLGRLLQYVADDEGKSVEEASFDILAEKYLKIECRIKGVSEIPTTKKADSISQPRKADKGTGGKGRSQSKKSK